MNASGSRVTTVVAALVSAGLVDEAHREDALHVAAAALSADRKPTSRRTLLVEIAAYAGGALVVASFGLFLAQYWADFRAPAQVAVLTAIAATLGFAGLAVSRVGQGYGTLRAGRDEVRRRLTSALLSSAAAAAGVAIGRLVELQVGDGIENDGWPVVAGGLTALLLACLAYVYVPSVVGQLTMAVAILVLVPAAWGLLDPDQSNPWWPGATFLGVGTLWLGGAETGVFREVVQARVIGVAWALFGAQLTLSGDHNGLSYLLTFSVSVAAFAMYLRQASWPYLLAGVVGITLVVPEAVIDWTRGSLGPAGAVLVAGVTLLCASLAGFRVHHGVAEDQSPAEPGRPTHVSTSDRS